MCRVSDKKKLLFESLQRNFTKKITKDGITLQHIAEMSLCCKVIPSFVIFAVFYV